MGIKEVVKGITNILIIYFSLPVFLKYTGKLIIEINCKNGGICSYDISTKQNIRPKDL